VFKKSVLRGTKICMSSFLGATDNLLPPFLGAPAVGLLLSKYS
jgi:hypothetical protein